MSTTSTWNYDLPTLRTAQERLQEHIHRTPMIRSATLSLEFGCNVRLKLEVVQKAGSFKARGMLNRLMTMERDRLSQGVITFSAGNAAQGLAYAAGIVGAKAVVAMPESASLAKVEATRGYGAEVILDGKNAAETSSGAWQRSDREASSTSPPTTMWS